MNKQTKMSLKYYKDIIWILLYSKNKPLPGVRDRNLSLRDG
ncbi:MAG: hypothetical protein LBG58_07325 [Planctomycetaceae bacterium]|nr:hypothetical protein [Planctomycetaceae bacterium]